MITEDDRLDAADKLFNELYQIGNNHGVAKHVPEIIKRLTLLEREGMSVTYPSGENTEDDFIVIEDYFEAVDNNADKSSRVMFYPMFSEDAKFGQASNYYVQSLFYAAYGGKSNSIIMNMSCKETLRFLACCFIHELGHAQAAKREGRLFKENSRSIDERIREEINMWTIDYKLMLALGGRNYQKAVKKMAFEIIQWWLQKRDRPDHQGTGIALNYCFGNLSDANSNNERDITFFTYCSFMAADYHFNKEGAEEAKFQMIQRDLIMKYNIESDLLSIFSKQ